MEIQPNPKPNKYLAEDRVIEVWTYGIREQIESHELPTYSTEAYVQGTLNFLTQCVETANKNGQTPSRIDVREIDHPELGVGVSYWHYDGRGELWHHVDVYEVQTP
jgi:hypothetical protein